MTSNAGLPGSVTPVSAIFNVYHWILYQKKIALLQGPHGGMGQQDTKSLKNP
jgi:hypothetical protein